MGNAYYHLGNEDQAINMLSKYVSSTDSPLRGDLYILGVCYYNKGNYSSAVNALGGPFVRTMPFRRTLICIWGKVI